MDGLLLLLIGLTLIIGLDLLAMRHGFDSREHIRDDRARPMAGT